jgi:TRAP-type C4-dicarboxylate transport system substrate-binding protein
MTRKTVRFVLAVALGVALAVPAMPALAQTIELKGASQFDDTHSYNQTMLKFEEEVKKCYAKPIKFTLHRNRELVASHDRACRWLPRHRLVPYMSSSIDLSRGGAQARL